MSADRLAPTDEGGVRGEADGALDNDGRVSACEGVVGGGGGDGGD